MLGSVYMYLIYSRVFSKIPEILIKMKTCEMDEIVNKTWSFEKHAPEIKIAVFAEKRRQLGNIYTSPFANIWKIYSIDITRIFYSYIYMKKRIIQNYATIFIETGSPRSIWQTFYWLVHIRM